MDHHIIEERSLIEHYLQGTLEDEERERFEAHFIDCPGCLEELEWGEDLAGAVKAAAAEGLIEPPRSEPVRWVHWLGSLEPAPRRALIAASLAGALLLPFFAGQYQGRAASPSPGLNTPLVYLSAVRGSETASTVQRLYLPTGREKGLLLVLEIGNDPAFEEYGVGLRSSDGELLWESSGLYRNASDSLTLTLPAKFLEAREYRLDVLGLLPGADPAEVASYAFRAVSPAT